jgi:hypothetical protein
MQTYGHKTRELLILASTEVENTWKSYMRIANVEPSLKEFTTHDYANLSMPLHLSEYQISLPRYADIPAIRPFCDWSVSQPSRSLPWYNAYNKTKHDRNVHFPEASFIHAVAANMLFSV